MKISSILKKKGDGVIKINEDKTIIEAIQLMNENKIGALLVFDNNDKLVGIITERDILKECGERGKLINKTVVKDVMTTNLIIGLSNDDVKYTMGVMTKNKIRHLPIMKKNKVAGIISIGDLVNSQLEMIEIQNRYMEEYIKNSYV